MHKIATAAMVTILVMVGCSCATPIAPEIQNPIPQYQVQRSLDAGPYRLLGEWTFFIDTENERVDVVPRRDLHMHLNALKFLEDYCKDCLEITSIKNNGDSTIDLTVRITNPFNGFPQYTGFDVKGIIMFNGSFECENRSVHIPLPTPTYRISWREMGDPEVLNPDGYTPRWNPNYESGSDLPIFNYWPGRYASGLPNADLNAYLDFYSEERRHMFAHNASVVRTYRIWLPPGPVVAGYAIEACWEPPDVTPVTNPLADFPATANQPEPYYFKFIINNGEVITDCEAYDPPGPNDYDCSKARAEIKQWGGLTSDRWSISWPDWQGLAGPFWECIPPETGHYYCCDVPSCRYGNGTFRNVLYSYQFKSAKHFDYAYAVFDYTVDDPDLD